MVRTIGGGDHFDLTEARYGVAVSWDEGQRLVDVDLQAVIIDDRGQVVDAVYYNNLKALKAVTHSGDETTGEKTGYDEMIWVTLTKLPANVKLIIFVVAAYRGGRLRDARNGKVHVLENNKDTEVAQIAMEQSEQAVDLVAMMARSESGAWALRVLDEPAESGQHFIDILEPTLGNVVRREIPGAPKRLKVAFAMEKGTVVDLPQSAAVKAITAGLGWDTAKGDVDLDVSAMLFDAAGNNKDTVFFGNLDGPGVHHSGDNLTGEGAGDDETIRVDLEKVPEWVHQIFFLVNIYSKGKTFQLVANPYCRILDSSSVELARYELKEAGNQSGLIIARLFREGSGVRWGFQAIGTFCRGHTWKDSVADVVPLCRKQPKELQAYGSTTRSLSGCGWEETPAVAAAVPPPVRKSAACVLM